MLSPASYQSSGSSGRTVGPPIKNVEQRLKRLSLKSGYPVVQRNGQRLYGPPPDWTGGEPPKGCEVFIGKLPREIIEDEIVPIFEKIGPLYLFRLMMDFSGTNRGYAFATYTNRKDAREAIKKLNGYEIRPYRQIGVVLSVDNCRLYLGRIPKTKTRSEVHQEISSLTEGVVDVILYPDAENKTMNRGFAFVEYCSHQAATAARRKLLPKHVMWGTEVEVDWAEPELEPDEDVISKVKNLYVRNLSPVTAEKQLKDLFESITGPKTVEHVKKLKDYAFVHFFDRKDAVEALQKANGQEVDGSVVEVVWAKPVDKTHQKLKNEQMAAAASHADGGVSALSLGPPTAASVGSAALFAPAPFAAVVPPYPFFLAAANPTVLATAPPAPHHPRHLAAGALLPHHQHSPAAAMMSLAGSANAVPYAGVPLIDPTAGNISQNTSPKNRSAAGMRSAGYNNSASCGNQRRLLRRKIELDTVVVKQQGSTQAQSNLSLLTNGDSLSSAAYANGTATTGHVYFVPSAHHPPHQQVPFAAAQHLTMIPSAAPLAYCQTASAPNLRSSSSTSSPPIAVSKSESFTKILERYCNTMGFSQPEYQQYETTVKDALNRDQPSFVFRVTIPQLVQKYGHFEPYSPAPTVEEAKQKAAIFVLLQLGCTFGKVNDFSEAHRLVYPHVFPAAGYIPCLVPDVPTFYAPFTSSAAQHPQAAHYFDTTAFQRQTQTIEQQATTVPVS